MSSYIINPGQTIRSQRYVSWNEMLINWEGMYHPRILFLESHNSNAILFVVQEDLLPETIINYRRGC